MKKLTKQDVIDGVLERWLKQYPEKDTTNSKWKAVTRRLREEKPTTEVEIRDIIGNTSWTQLWCHNCNTEVDVVVVFDRDDTEFRICLDCLKAANKLIK